jgi:hypothetical protein
MGAFSRDRTITFQRLLVAVIQMGTSSLQRELNKFFKDVSDSEFNIQEVTKGAFSQSRAKLKPEAFLELVDVGSQEFYKEYEWLAYEGHRLLSIDGSRLGNLPNHPTIKEEFGSNNFGPNADVEKSAAILSLLYDVANYITLDAQITGYNGSEKELLLRHLEKVNAGDILLLDRGYPSKFLFALLHSKGIHFCVRMKEMGWQEVADFCMRDENDKQVIFKLSPNQIKEYSGQYPGLPTEIKCRLIKITLENGTEEILCTSLIDSEKYKYEDFKDLYHLRWGVEEGGYKMLKARVNVEAFTGKTAIAVKQDIYAKVFLMTLCAIYAFPVEQKVKKEYQDNLQNKHPQKINRTNAIAYCRSIVTAIFLKKKPREAIKAFEENIFKTREIIRPGRANPRNHKQRRKYHMNYKDL